MQTAPITTPSTAYWHLLERIDAIFDAKQPLSQQLQQLNQTLLDALPVEAVWCISLMPTLPATAGLVHTPLRVAPEAQVMVIDDAPALVHPGTLMHQAISNQTVLFLAEPQPPVDNDLGDTLFNTFEIAANAALPLVSQQTVWGVLILGQPQATYTPFSTDLQQFLTYLSYHLGKNLYQLHLITNAQRYTHTTFMLNEIAHTITSSLHLDEVIQKTMAGINRLLDVEAGSLLLVDEQTHELFFKVTLRGENEEITSYRLQPGEGLAGWVVTNNEAVIVNQPEYDPRFSSKIDQAIGFKTRSVLCVPLVVQDKPIGALEVLNKRRTNFETHDMDLLTSVAASLSTAVTNIRLYESVRHRANQNEIINRIAAAINAGHSLSDTGRLIFEQLSQLFSFDHISFAQLNQATNKIRQWTFGLYGCLLQKQPPIFVENSRLNLIIQSNRGYVEDDIAADHQKWPDYKILYDDSIKSVVSVPLSGRTAIYGSLTIGSRQPYTYGLSQLTALEQLAPHLAIVIEKALILDDMEQRTNELQMLNRLSEMIVSTVDMNVIIQSALSMLPRILPGDIHGIIIADEEGAHIGLAVPYRFGHTHQTLSKMLNLFNESNQNESEPIEVVSSKIIAGHMPVAADWQLAKERGFPILTSRGTRGVIYTATGAAEDYDANFLRTFSLFTSQITATVENAQLFFEVQRESARLAAILASTTDAVLVVNRNGRIVLDNPAARDILGVTESQRDQPLVQSTDLQSLINLFNSAMQGGKTSGEIVLDDGRTFFANLSPVAIGDSDIIGWVATIQDISHFKELDQIKNDFVSTVSHDLRSPLSGILIATKLLKDDSSATTNQQRLIDIIESRVQGMSQLIDDLLNVGSIEAGIDIELKPCDLAEVVRESVVALRPEAEEKNILLKESVQSSPSRVLANANRFRQVVYNLVSNAIKYTPNDGRIEVKLHTRDGELHFQVSDTGLGIPPNDQPHIFEKFYRVKGEHMLHIKGTGLGLAIVKSVVERHHGRIWLESIVDQGSTFNVALPLYPITPKSHN